MSLSTYAGAQAWFAAAPVSLAAGIQIVAGIERRVFTNAALDTYITEGVTIAAVRFYQNDAFLLGANVQANALLVGTTTNAVHAAILASAV
jgi:hypothetical protein